MAEDTCIAEAENPDAVRRLIKRERKRRKKAEAEVSQLRLALREERRLRRASRRKK